MYHHTQCLSQVREAFSQIDKMITNQELSQLAKDFNSCEPLSGRGDVYQFVSNLADAFMGVVQYNGEVAEQNITGLCLQMTESQDSYANLQKLYQVTVVPLFLL